MASSPNAYCLGEQLCISRVCAVKESHSLCALIWPLLRAADVGLVNWEGDGTALQGGHATVRMETNRVECWATERLPTAGQWATGQYTTDPAKLLCRALRLAPACYCRFEWTAAVPEAPLELGAFVLLVWSFVPESEPRDQVASFDSVGDLAAVLQEYAAAEGLSVQLSQDERTVVISRDRIDTACWRD